MKKLGIILIGILFFCGCSLAVNNDAKGAVREYLNKFKMHDEDILKELDDYVEKQDLTNEHKEKYKDILKKQYKDMKYEIVDEKYDGDSAVVKVKVTVYDLYDVQKKANDYLLEHEEEFQDENGIHDPAKYLNYKLDKMRKQEETIDYTIDIHLDKKENDNWKVRQLSDEDLEKIHGIYNYEN